MRPYCDICEREVSGPTCDRHPENPLLDLDDPGSAAFADARRAEKRQTDRDLSERAGMWLFGFVGALAGLAFSFFVLAAIATEGGSASIKLIIGAPIVLGGIGIALGRYVPIGRLARRLLVAAVLVATPVGWWVYDSVEDARREESERRYQEEMARQRAEDHRRTTLQRRCEYEFDDECRREALRLFRPDELSRAFDPEGTEQRVRQGRIMLQRGCELGDTESCSALTDEPPSPYD